MFSCRSDIDLNNTRRCFAFGTCRDDHDIGIPREEGYVRIEMSIFHFHSLKLRMGFRTGDFELLHNIGDTLETITIILFWTDRNEWLDKLKW